MIELMSAKFRDDFATGLSSVFGGVRELNRLAAGFTHRSARRDRSAAERLLEYIGRGAAELLGDKWPDWSSLTAVSPQVMRMLEEHRVEFKRVAQLAVPAVAAKTGPRFCAGGADKVRGRTKETTCRQSGQCCSSL